MIIGIILMVLGTLTLLFGYHFTKQHIKPTNWVKYSTFLDLFSLTLIGTGTFLMAVTT